jgi:hypothetical protein
MKNSGRLWRTFIKQNLKKQNVLDVCNLILPKSFIVTAIHAKLGIALNQKGTTLAINVTTGHAI